MTTEAKSFVDDTPDEAPVRGYLHRAGDSANGFLVLTHGAGGNCNAPLLVELAEKFAASGLTVLRCDLPYRQRRPQFRRLPGRMQRIGQQEQALNQ